MHAAHKSTQSPEKNVYFARPAGGSVFFKYQIKAEHTNNFS